MSLSSSALALIDDQIAFFMEHPGNAARLAHVAAGLAENIPDLGNGPVPVVGHDLDNDRNAARSVSFIHDLLVGDSRQFARALSGSRA